MKLGIAYCTKCGKVVEMNVSVDPAKSQHLRRFDQTMCTRCNGKTIVAVFELAKDPDV